MSSEKKCPVCFATMKGVKGKVRYEVETEHSRKFTADASTYVCIGCGNVQQFIPLTEIRPLLEV
jgi:hypothetical protein